MKLKSYLMKDDVAGVEKNYQFIQPKEIVAGFNKLTSKGVGEKDLIITSKGKEKYAELDTSDASGAEDIIKKFMSFSSKVNKDNVTFTGSKVKFRVE